jgi:micrococcal nuclease
MYLYDARRLKDDEDIFVKEVIDGDTIIISTGQSVRLIGINTPETDMAFFEEAKQYLKYLVRRKQVVLEKDVSDIDQYGRLLRYVYRGDTFINLEMVRSGFANSYTYPPDVKYESLFLKAERDARDSKQRIMEKIIS